MNFDFVLTGDRLESSSVYDGLMLTTSYGENYAKFKKRNLCLYRNALTFHLNQKFEDRRFLHFHSTKIKKLQNNEELAVRFSTEIYML